MRYEHIDCSWEFEMRLAVQDRRRRRLHTLTKTFPFYHDVACDVTFRLRLTLSFGMQTEQIVRKKRGFIPNEEDM